MLKENPAFFLEERRPPRRIVAIAGVLIVLASVAGLVYVWFHVSIPPVLPQPSAASRQNVSNLAVDSSKAAPVVPAIEESLKPAAKAPSRTAIALIAHNDLADAVRLEVERMTRPKSAALALFDNGTNRLACLLVDSDIRYFQLDYGLRSENLAALKAGLFQEPPEPVAKTISRYRSVAKRAMHYRSTGEDRLIVLLCPAGEWPALNLTYSEFAPDALPGSVDTPVQPRF
jgi:hypothetical protein